MARQARAVLLFQTRSLGREDRRGAFLGVWTLFTNMGQITGPLVIGSAADAWGFTTAFVIVGIVLVAGAVVMALLGRETGRASG